MAKRTPQESIRRIHISCVLFELALALICVAMLFTGDKTFLLTLIVTLSLAFYHFTLYRAASRR